MQRTAVWWSAISLIGVVVFSAGCQFSGIRSARREPVERRDRQPSARQVADVQLSLARSLERRGEVEPALDAYRKAVEKDPRRVTGYWRMAILQDRQGNFEESEVLYRKALKIDPKNSDLLCDYGYSLYLHRRWAEAEERLHQAISLKPKHARAHNHLGLVLAQEERVEEALTEFRKAGCEEADAHINLALVMTLNRRWDEARQQYQLALDLESESAAAISGLEKLNAVIAKLPENSQRVSLAGYERQVNESPVKTATDVRNVPSRVVRSTTDQND